MSEGNIQEELVDVSSTGKIRNWKDKKIRNLMVSEAYKDVDMKKFNRLQGCATFVSFSIDSLRRKKLNASNFCRVRLCPMCTWRRSLKIFSQVKRITDAMNKRDEYRYLFLTLTVKNCAGEDLLQNLDVLSYAWKKFSKNESFKRAIRGWYRGLEITHNVFDGTYHPHFHCLLAVKSAYFTSRDYLTQAKLTEMWRAALNVRYIPVVNVKKVRGVTARAIAEVAKYAVKDADYINPEDWKLTVETVRLLDRVLDHRRLVAFGGIFKEWHKKLNLDDAVDGDLVHVDLECSEVDEDGRVVSYEWNVGYQQYRLVK